MAAATDRASLLAVHDTEYAKLVKTLDGMDAETALLSAPTTKRGSRTSSRTARTGSGCS
ncbi:hypothetical protein [Parasphingopyxis algicola]|uniref:hypothetical protein n=1 Tax=Parasphingopyxis algicola TaxID=2026624 RepID=UPI001FE93456|nr:hypothetical protein [Parasphingopyxis algicola]